MATYALGDIQGCFRTLSKLLERMAFDERRDRLWLTGDLVNRGPRSLEVLRWTYRNRGAIKLVLGNHDLHLIARAAGAVRSKKRDTFEEILEAPDGADLVDWLAQQPLIVREGDMLMVHAALLPVWTVDEATARAEEAEAMLRRPDRAEWIAPVLGKKGDWDSSIGDLKRLTDTISIMTRMRMVTAAGEPTFDYAGSPEAAPSNRVPWFRFPGRRTEGIITIIFGHWASLGRRIEPGIMALDSGCVWGRALSAIRLEDNTVYEEDYCG